MTAAQKKTPRYIEVANDLRQAIETGTYAVGDALPTETDLCAQYSISRYTIREALRRLQEAGVVARRQGSGTIVTSQERAALFQQQLGSLDDLVQYASGVRFELSPPSVGALPAELHPYVDTQESTDWTLRSALAFQRHLQRPLAHSDIYMPSRYRSIAADVQGNRGALFNEFEILTGHSIETVEQDIRAIIVPEDLCEALDCAPGAAGLKAIRAYYDRSGAAMISITYHPGDRYAYRMRLHRAT